MPTSDAAAARDDAVALVAASVLFDHAWYARTAGTSFTSREAAARHWVAQEAPSAAPHPLVEPAWLYPGGRWRRHAPDPLSFYLVEGPGRRSPHPRYPEAELGPLVDWLAGHDPAELLPTTVERAPVAPVVVRAQAGRLPQAVAWARHLARLGPGVTGQLLVDDVASTRVLHAVVADLPTLRVGGSPLAAPLGPEGVEVDVDLDVRPPRWTWLDPLLSAVRAPGVAAAQAALSAEDATVAAPLLVGHAFGDLERLDGRRLDAESHPGVVARRPGTVGDLVLAAHARLPGPTSRTPPGAPDETPTAREPLLVTEQPGSLRWSIDVAAPFMGVRWGDTHFARSLASALERRGQRVVLDHPESRGRATRGLDDVVLTLRGLDDVTPPEHTVNLLWVISHPDLVSAAEVARYDAAFAAGPAWAAARSGEWGRSVRPLPQCTDTTRFHPGLGEPGDEALFVGSSRGELRGSVAAAIEAGLPLTVIGSGWEPWLPAGDVRWAADRVPNAALGTRYATAGVVLNDHWDDMREQGFVSNRVFDVLATGGRLVTDDVAGLADLVGPDVPVWRTPADLAHLARPPFPAHPDAAARLALAERVVAEHSFDARAATLLDTALRLRA